ncbi:EamA family transporter [Agathobaculum sp. NTUH-O15-33]|uniref:EamA family transporter n=1 Tax=Agathobaculum sp. NTUH-O15-33 TaxID=3079302 RepID=UPI003FA47142
MLSKKSKAIGFILLSAFGFAAMNALVRLAGDLPFTQKAFFRNCVAMIFAGFVLKRNGVGFRWGKGNLPLLTLRAVCGTLGIFCNFYAVDHLLLADANILNKMSPFFAILFSLALLRERANLVQYGAVLAAFGARAADHQARFFLGGIPGAGRSGGRHGGGRGLYGGTRAVGAGRKERADRVFLFCLFHAGNAAVFDI